MKLSHRRENFERAYAALERMVNLLRSQPVDPENDLYWSAMMSVIKGMLSLSALTLCVIWMFLQKCSHLVLEENR